MRAEHAHHRRSVESLTWHEPWDDAKGEADAKRYLRRGRRALLMVASELVGSDAEALRIAAAVGGILPAPNLSLSSGVLVTGPSPGPPPIAGGGTMASRMQMRPAPTLGLARTQSAASTTDDASTMGDDACAMRPAPGRRRGHRARARRSSGRSAPNTLCIKVSARRRRAPWMPQALNAT